VTPPKDGSLFHLPELRRLSKFVNFGMAAAANSPRLFFAVRGGPDSDKWNLTACACAARAIRVSFSDLQMAVGDIYMTPSPVAASPNLM
jgi:hypothetical protein